jgi:hypothetical protein
MQFEPRRMDFGDIIDSSVKLFTRNFSPLVILIAIFSGPLDFAIQYINAHIFKDQNLYAFVDGLFKGLDNSSPGSPPFESMANIFEDEKNIYLLIYMYIILNIMALLAPIGNLAAVKHISEKISGRSISIGGAIKTGIRHYVTFIISSIILSFILSIIILLLMIPMIPCIISMNPVALVLGLLGFFVVLLFLSLFYQVFINIMTCIIVVEGADAAKAIHRSFALLKGFFWRTLGIIVAVSMIIGLITSIFSGIGKMIGGMVPGNAGVAVIATVATLFSLMFQPVLWCVSYLVYMDIRIRKENYDMEIMTQRSLVSSKDSSSGGIRTDGWG